MLSLKAIALLALPFLAVADPIVSFCSGPFHAINDEVIFVVRQGWWL